MRWVPLVVILVARVAAAETAPDPTPTAAVNPTPASAVNPTDREGQLVPVQPAACDPHEAQELREHLLAEQHRAKRWNTTWAIVFGAASVGSLALAVANPLPDMQAGLYVSAGKAGIGALGRVVLPLRVDVPDPNSDTCADIVALRSALATAAKRERANFYTHHVGAILLNGGGAAILWATSGWQQAALSVAVGYPVAMLSAYLAPRGSWHRYRERTWTVAVMPQPNGWGVAIAGAL